MLQAGFVILAFGCLAASYFACDFSVALVARHSNTRQPLAYRIAATPYCPCVGNGAPNGSKTIRKRVPVAAA